MGIGLANPDELDEDSRGALEVAADTLRFTWLQDVCATSHTGVLDPDSDMAQHLPPKHGLRYTRTFAANFLGALYVVLDRLADRSNEVSVYGTTAQELAFRALIDEAVDWLDGGDQEPLWDFYHRRVHDTDIEMLFEASLDGLEDPELHTYTSPPVNLEFDHWFAPFGGAWPPAPVPDEFDD